MRRNLLIVDDEKNIRIGLKTMLEREYPEQYEIRMASNGKVALDLYREVSADIVITDIRMPVMDGIQLLKELAQGAGDQGPAVIILSGYDDFEYAKTAIKYKVKEYLLKPIRREELFECMNRLEQELQQQEAANRQRAEENKLLLKELRTNRLQQLLFSQESWSEAELSHFEKETQLDLSKGSTCIAVLHYRHEDGSRMTSGELQRLVERLASAMPDRLEWITSDLEGRVVLYGQSRSWYTELSRQAQQKGWQGLRIGISRERHGLFEVQVQYKDALKALQYTMLYPNMACMEIEGLEEERLRYPLPYEELRKLGNMLGTDREKEMLALLRAIFHIDQLQQMDMTYLEQVSRLMNEKVLDDVFLVYGEASVEVLKLYRKVGNMHNFQSFHDYYRRLEHLLVRVNDYVSQIRSAHSEHTDMKKAVEFIQEHYARSLNMAMVSNHVSLNYSYFSEAFKAYTGESFVLYLKKVRIHKAKEMISTTTLRLSRISELVGFDSSKQFARVFKELEGISPQEYRQKVQLSSGL